MSDHDEAMEIVRDLGSLEHEDIMGVDSYGEPYCPLCHGVYKRTGFVHDDSCFWLRAMELRKRVDAAEGK